MSAVVHRLALSALAHTWLIDVDGTIFAHNSHLRGADELLPGVAEFWNTIPVVDRIILLSARAESLRTATATALARHGLRHDMLILDLPLGERIVLNDMKPSGLRTALAVNLVRDQGLVPISIAIDSQDPTP